MRAVDARLELLLEDGRVVKIAGLDPPRPTPDAPELDEEAAREAGERLVGREIVLAPLYTAPDRWGRVVAEVFAPAPGGAATASIAGGLLRAGLGRVEAGAAARRCRAYLLGEEAAARAARLGVWADPYYAVLRPADRAGFAERAGTLAIVEGEVVGIEVSDFRTTLTFGERRGQAFSIVVAARNLKRFSAAGVDLAALRGKIVRARGLVDLRFGPQIEIEEPGEIEASAPGAADGRADAR
ncbi:thermonuclease family protein [Methylocella sp.]|uniref:thermonuclease family protein n=1 Tax=Methylocella sp. TaxID=1978226 RepID=UPI00378374B8